MIRAIFVHFWLSNKFLIIKGSARTLQNKKTKKTHNYNFSTQLRRLLQLNEIDTLNKKTKVEKHEKVET